MKKRLPGVLRSLALAALLLASLAAAADPSRQKQKSGHDWQQYKQLIDHAAPVFQDVSVHDPSVIRVGEEYYVFGSHLAAAKTGDLLQWDLVADGVNANNPLFDNVVEELEEIFDWSGAVGLWANDVIQLRDGRFYMYPNRQMTLRRRSARIADDIEGHTHPGIFLQSGIQISEDGVNVYDPKIHPNNTDPTR
jgi:arabinan endo-1,5-alpha-L-arabinosidase